MTTTIDSDESVRPLTTTFTTSSCASSDGIYSSFDEDYSEIASGLTAFYTWTGITQSNDAECYPTGWETISYYSPGLCPLGYTIATSDIVTKDTVTETQATCCFTKFAIATDYPDLLNDDYPCVSYPIETSSADYGVDWYYTVAGAVSVRWQSTDFSTTPTMESTTSVPRATSATKAGSLPKEASGASPAGLSTGAKAGIGAGVACGGLAIIIAVLAVFFLRRRRNKANQAYGSVDSISDTKDVSHSSVTHELSASDVYGKGAMTHELPTKDAKNVLPAQELQGSTWNAKTSPDEVYELPAMTNDSTKK